MGNVGLNPKEIFMEKDEIKKSILDILQPLQKKEDRVLLVGMFILFAGIVLGILLYSPIILGVNLFWSFVIVCALYVISAYAIWRILSSVEQKALKAYCEKFQPNSTERSTADKIISSFQEFKLAADILRRKLGTTSEEYELQMKHWKQDTINALKSERNFYKKSMIVEKLGKTRDPVLVKDLIASLYGGSGYAFQKTLLVSEVTDALVQIGPVCAHELVPLLLSRKSVVQQVIRDALLKMKWKPANPVEDACFVIAEKGMHSGAHVDSAIDAITFEIFGKRKLQERLKNLENSLIAVVRNDSVNEDLRTLASDALTRLKEYVSIDPSQETKL